MHINLIVANSRNKVIGKDGKMPWKISKELERFKAITKGSVVIMGRKTFESIGGTLSDRINCIISKNEINVFGAHSFKNVDEVLDYVSKWFYDYEVFVIGGSSIYKQFLEQGLVDKIYQTIIEKDFEGDVFFDFDQSKWIQTKTETCEVEIDNKKVKLNYLTWMKK